MARKHVNISPWKHPPHSASKYGWMFDMRRWSHAGASYDVIWLSGIWSICDASYWSTNALCTGCPHSISGEYSGRFRSPYYPRNYPNNKNCNWHITVPSGYSVRVLFSHFNTEEDYDYLRIYDGPSASSPLLVDLTGDLSTPRGVISMGSSLWFNFRTDETVSRRGFEATFTLAWRVSCSTMVAITIINPIYGRLIQESMTLSMNQHISRAAVQHPDSWHYRTRLPGTALLRWTKISGLTPTFVHLCLDESKNDKIYDHHHPTSAAHTRCGFHQFFHLLCRPIATLATPLPNL